jgi:hypothetical protein
LCLVANQQPLAGIQAKRAEFENRFCLHGHTAFTKALEKLYASLKTANDFAANVHGATGEEPTGAKCAGRFILHPSEPMSMAGFAGEGLLQRLGWRRIFESRVFRLVSCRASKLCRRLRVDGLL